LKVFFFGWLESKVLKHLIFAFFLVDYSFVGYSLIVLAFFGVCYCVLDMMKETHFVICSQFEEIRICHIELL